MKQRLENKSFQRNWVDFLKKKINGIDKSLAKKKRDKTQINRIIYFLYKMRDLTTEKHRTMKDYVRLLWTMLCQQIG